MTTVTISKKEYQELFDRALRYQYLQSLFQKDIFVPPPVKDVKSIIKGFRATKRYKKKFLESLEQGLSRSSYFQQ